MQNKSIPLGRPFLNKEAILDEISKVLDTRWISGGLTISKFEEAIKEYNKTLKAIMLLFQMVLVLLKCL